MTARQPRYLDVDLPERFVLEVRASDGGWIEHAGYEAAWFMRDDDGTYVCSSPHGGSPTFIRCIERVGDVLTVLDGAGAPFAYRVVPLA